MSFQDFERELNRLARKQSGPKKEIVLKVSYRQLKMVWNLLKRIRKFRKR